MFANLMIKTRLTFVLAALVLLTLIVGSLGLWGMNQSNRGLYTVYVDRTIPVGDLSTILYLVMQNRVYLMDAAYEPTEQNVRQATAGVARNRDEVTRLWQDYMQTTLTEEESRLAAETLQARTAFVNNALNPGIAALSTGRFEDARRIAFDEMDELYDPVSDSVRALLDLQLRVAAQEYEEAEALFGWIRGFTIGAMLIGFALSVFIGRMLIAAIANPLEQAVRVANAIAQGDLTQRIEVGSRDEVGRMLEAMRDMSGNLDSLVIQIMESATNVATGANQIAAGNVNLSQRTEEQASSLEETASSMEELTATVKQNADNAGQANQLASAARDSAEKGGQVVAKAVSAMGEINASSKRVADIVGVIDEIAFQTNLLALNAAVEAARAGEQGRGFAVVAAEVRSLAQRSASSAKEIKDLIGDSVQKVDEGAALVEESGKTLEEIVGRVKKVTDIVAEIAAASQEQSAGIEQVNKAVMQLDELTQQNAALVEEASAASQSMSEQATTMSSLLARYKVTRAITRSAPKAAAPAQVSAPKLDRRSTSRPWTATQAVAKPAPVKKAAGGDEWEEF